MSVESIDPAKIERQRLYDIQFMKCEKTVKGRPSRDSVKHLEKIFKDKSLDNFEYIQKMQQLIQEMNKTFE